jgi:hypothetical protein
MDSDLAFSFLVQIALSQIWLRIANQHSAAIFVAAAWIVRL